MRKATNKLTLIYYCIYFVAVLLAIGGYYYMTQKEIRMEEYGQNGTTTLISIYLIYMIASIPLSLKFFNSAVKKLSALEISAEDKIKKYTQYSLLRLLVIAVSLFIGIILFYTLNSRSMIFCAGIAAVALVFCKPSEAKMATELNIDEE